MLQYNKNSVTVAYRYLDIIKSLLFAPIPVLIILASMSSMLTYLFIIYLFFLPFLIATSILLNKFKLLNFITIFLTALGILLIFNTLANLSFKTFFSELIFSWIGISTLITAFNFWALLTWYNYKDNKTKEQNINIE
ncbi:hypothetical protein D3C81_487250 [compost metagenome]|jgi:hypothetical protein|nr:hypothetical protein UF12_13160 [Acinetobacter calcoaceticus]CAI3147655.1 hypothetical protein MWMV18_MWMV18_01629 [Acinetobacter calcoaceticus]SEO87258.1 hypothetical protein SAMN04487817_12320 [Acinetobacter sp. yr461]